MVSISNHFFTFKIGNYFYFAEGSSQDPLKTAIDFKFLSDILLKLGVTRGGSV